MEAVDYIVLGCIVALLIVAYRVAKRWTKGD